MDFFGKNHHLETFFLSLPNKVRLASKLYRMQRNKSSTREIRGASGFYRLKSEFGRKLCAFFPTMSHVSHI
jgi:hypothetical protein